MLTLIISYIGWEIRPVRVTSYSVNGSGLDQVGSFGSVAGFRVSPSKADERYFLLFGR